MLRKLNLTHLAAAVLLVYTLLHIHEEAAGALHLWMGENWGVTGISFGRWLFHNAVFFTPVLMAGLFVHLLEPDRLRVIAVAILIWGLLNFFEHFIFTIINFSYAPGLFSGFLFAALAVLGVLRLIREDKFRPPLLLAAFAFQAVFFWILPMASFLLLRDHIGKIVGG